MWCLVARKENKSMSDRQSDGKNGGKVSDVSLSDSPVAAPSA